ncbi:MAG: response regulator [Dehalococcoidales bacterium]|nr:response regulator [Dehalococcoidales bacterium]
MKPILVVDDEAIVRESIRDWLKDSGYQVRVAESGEEALKLIEKHNFGVMILDLRLPGMNGIDVLKKVKVLKPNIKSIVITAYPTMLTQEEATKLGVIDYMVKPILPDKLEGLILETLDKAEDEK